MDTLIKLAEKMPEMAALIVLVWLFLKAQSEARREYLASIELMHKEHSVTMQQIQSENLDARAAMRTVIRDNTDATGKLTEAVRALEKDMRR